MLPPPTVGASHFVWIEGCADVGASSKDMPVGDNAVPRVCGEGAKLALNKRVLPPPKTRTFMALSLLFLVVKYKGGIEQSVLFKLLVTLL